MESPIVKSTVQATLLGATSNILAQAITAYRENRPLRLDIVPILQFMFFSILSTPPNYLWQQWLEEKFPGSKAGSRANASGEKAAKVKGGPERAAGGKIDVKNTVAKFLLDQTVGAVVNTVLFIAGMAAIKGLGWGDIVTAVKKDTLPIMFAGMKLWPMVSIVSFSIIPPDRRVVFGSLVGVVWGIYLSLVSAS